MTEKRSGRCACGQVTLEFEFDPTFVAICHCLDCKKASGGEAATFFAVPEDDFRLLSGDPKSFPYIAQSGNRLERFFCPNCGARVFTGNLEGFPKTVFVQLASLDDPTGIDPRLEMFTKRRLPWATPLDLPQFTDMPTAAPPVPEKIQVPMGAARLRREKGRRFTPAWMQPSRSMAAFHPMQSLRNISYLAAAS